MTAGTRKSFGDPSLANGEPFRNDVCAGLVGDFLRAVKIPGTTFSTLQVFLEALERNSEELVWELVRRSTGTEISCLLNNAQKLKPADIALIFTVLEKIILTVASQVEGRESFALELAEVLIAKHLRTFYYMLRTSNKSNQIKSALKLLIAMCALGGKTVKVLMSQFDFVVCSFTQLVTRRNTVDPQDVRACAIHFIVAVLMFGETGSIWVLMQTKNVIASLFSGLAVDRPELIDLLLSTLLDRIVKNPAVSKTLKIQLFNQTSLKQLCKLFAWNGMKKSEKEFIEDDITVNSSMEERSSVRDSVLRFLVTLCSSTKFGIVFQDASFGTSTKNYNHVLTELLRTLTFSSAYHRELARTILIAAPDQIVHFLPSWKPGFVPRSSEKWAELMLWLDSVYADVDVVKKLRKIPGKSRASLALCLVLPPIMDRQLQSEAFAEKQPVAVCITLLKFLQHVLLRVYKISFLLAPEEKKQFLEGCLEKIINPEIVAECLSKLLTVPEETDGKISETDVHTFVSFFLLDSAVVSRDFPNTISDHTAVVQAELHEKESVSAELTKVVEEVRSVLGGATGDVDLQLEVGESVPKGRDRKTMDEILRLSTCKMLFELLETDPAGLTTSLLDMLMSAYNATLSEADQFIFEIIRRGEQVNPDVKNMVSFSLFGRLAQKHQLLRSKQGINLIPSQPTLREFVDGLDSNVIARTALDFPIRLPLNGSLIGQLVNDAVYDPRYLLSNFAALITAPNSPINLQHFVESGCLGLVVRSLSSLDGAMRAAAAFCLRSLAVRAESLRFKGKEQMLYVLDLIKRGNNPEKPWPNLWTVLLNRFFSVMFDSQNHAYQVIMEFLLVKPKLGLDTVPEFYKLFESGNLTHVRERKLILEMMRDGTQHYRDYELGRNSHAWEMIMSFYGSPLSNAALNILISEVFLAASRVPFVGRGLVKANGLFTWLTYQLVVDDNTEAVGYLIVSARNCISDLLLSKQRKCFDARRLVKPLLQSVDRGVAALTATESVLLFFSDLLLFWPSQDPVLLILTPAEVNSVIDIGVNYLRHARRNLDAEHWRHRCCRAMKTISHLRLMQEVSDSVVPVYLLQKFVSDVVGVVYSVDVD